MQILPETPGDTSGETSSESSPSPHTPLDAGAHFMHTAMNQQIVQDTLYPQNYSLSNDSSCIDHLAQATSLSYSNNGVQDSSRRDSELTHHSSALSRPLGHRSTTNDPAFHPPAEQSSGSISTSPSSNYSSAAYTLASNRQPYNSSLNLPTVHGAQHSFSNPQPLPANSATTYAFGGMPAQTSIDHSSGYLPSQHPPSQQSAFSNSNPVSPNVYRERYQRVPITNLSGNGKFYSAASSSGAERYSTGNYFYSPMPTDPSRLLPSSINMATTSTAYGTQAVQGQETPPFSAQENFHEIQANGDVVKPLIDAKIEKGFFISGDSCWTCYRRNYFAVQCSYQLTPHASNAQHFLIKDGEHHPIQAMAMSLSARVDGTAGKNIELVQHTPKRDKGPQSHVQMTKLCPTPPGGKLGHLPHADTHHYGMLSYGGIAAGHIAPPHFPLQSHQDAGTPLQDSNNPNHNAPPSPTAHQHTFERIQFKSATANNGKRRAQQQYYHLIVELHADIRDSTAHSPKWVKVAERVSSQVVVRGRSPSHYQNEGPNSASNPRGGGNGAGGGGSYTMGGYGGYGGLPTTGGASYSRPLGGSYGMSGYRGNQLAHDPMSSHAVSSSSSVAGVESFMDHSNNILMTSTATPDFMQPAPTSFSSTTGLPSLFMPKSEDKFFLSSRMPPMETSAHTTVYAA